METPLLGFIPYSGESVNLRRLLSEASVDEIINNLSSSKRKELSKRLKLSESLPKYDIDDPWYRKLNSAETADFIAWLNTAKEEHTEWKSQEEIDPIFKNYLRPRPEPEPVLPYERRPLTEWEREEFIKWLAKAYTALSSSVSQGPYIRLAFPSTWWWHRLEKWERIGYICWLQDEYESYQRDLTWKQEFFRTHGVKH